MKYNPYIVQSFFEQQGLPSSVTEHQFDSVTERKWRFDFAWLDERVALEVEGGIWTGGGHSRGSGVKKDMEKYNAATLQGWRVLRVTPQHLCTMETVRMLKQMFGYIEIQHGNKH